MSSIVRLISALVVAFLAYYVAGRIPNLLDWVPLVVALVVFAVVGSLLFYFGRQSDDKELTRVNEQRRRAGLPPR